MTLFIKCFQGPRLSECSSGTEKVGSTIGASVACLFKAGDPLAHPRLPLAATGAGATCGRLHIHLHLTAAGSIHVAPSNMKSTPPNSSTSLSFPSSPSTPHSLSVVARTSSAISRLSQISQQTTPPSAVMTSTTLFDAKAVPQAPEDPLFGLMAAYRADSSDRKVDLGIGAYRDNNAKPWILPVVKKVRRIIPHYIPLTRAGRQDLHFAA
jgi:hypothetical protein